MHDLLAHLLTASPVPPPAADIPAWWAHHLQVTTGEADTVAGALRAGFAMDRLGYVFASGYQQALRRLAPAAAPVPTAFAATEQEGVHPRAIHTRLTADGDGWRLSGSKELVTLGAHAARILVVASAGRDAHRNHLALVSIPADRAGLALTPRPPLPFVPEISHAKAILDEVRVEPDERLPGDGYARYLKPFRTLEDLHVFAAVLGWLVQIARRTGARPQIEALLALAGGALALGEVPRGDPAGHVALAGLLSRVKELAEDLDWPAVDAETHQRWQRDRPLLEVAGRARARRLEVAWSALAGDVRA